MSDDLPTTIADAAVALRAGTLTSVALTQSLLARADAHDATIFVAKSRSALCIVCMFVSPMRGTSSVHTTDRYMPTGNIAYRASRMYIAIGATLP